MPQHPPIKRNTEIWILLIIIVVAVFFRFYDITGTPQGLLPEEALDGNDAVSAMQSNDYKFFYEKNNVREGLFTNLQTIGIAAFGFNPWALRVVPAVAGVLTVLGLYFLTRILINRQLAALASFMFAVSFWHVLFSRLGLRIILVPLIFVWTLFILWKGKQTGEFKYYAIAGILCGVGFYSHTAFIAVTIPLILMLLVYGYALRKAFGTGKFEETKLRTLRGLALFVVIVILITLPLAYHYIGGSQITDEVSVLVGSQNDTDGMLKNFIRTVIMFTSSGDTRWEFNIPGNPMLFWPVGILFILGFVRSVYKLFKSLETHGHLSTVQVILIGWLVIGLAPAVVTSGPTPSAVLALVVSPVLYIFAAEGLWWIYSYVSRWYSYRDSHQVNIHNYHWSEGTVVASLGIAIFFCSLTLYSFNQYFVLWGQDPRVNNAYGASNILTAYTINQVAPSRELYIVVSETAAKIDGIPISAQPIMFLTDTATEEKRKAKRVHYITESESETLRIRGNNVIIPDDDMY